jgi:hypothetical protein
MPRFRFQWGNIAEVIRTELAMRLRLPDATPESFRTVFGLRPRADFVQKAWPILIDAWLFHDDAAALRIASALRGRDLGDMSIEHELQYLQSCRNTTGLRDIVLAEFITLGERTKDQFDTVPRHGVHTPSGASPKTMIQPSEHNPLAHILGVVVAVIKENAADKKLAVTSDGDLQLSYGSSIVYINVKAEPLCLRIYAEILSNIPATAALYETLNHININLPAGRIFAINDMVVLECSIPIEAFSPEHLMGTIETVGYIADTLDNRLAATFGGTLRVAVPPEDTIDV